MADRFGCDLEAVERTARRLAAVAEEMRTFGRRGDDFAPALRSSLIQQAIHSFEDDSSDQRDTAVQAVDALKRVLDGLVAGCRAVDEALASGLAEFDKSTSALVKGSAAGSGASA